MSKDKKKPKLRKLIVELIETRRVGLTFEVGPFVKWRLKGRCLRMRERVCVRERERERERKREERERECEEGVIMDVKWPQREVGGVVGP